VVFMLSRSRLRNTLPRSARVRPGNGLFVAFCPAHV